MNEPQWLTPRERTAWMRLAAVLELLPAALDSQLQRDARLGRFEYFVLAMLSEAPEHTLRMSSLATRTNATLARLSRVVTKLEDNGLVKRSPSAQDRRATDVTLTERGWDKVVATAPGHVAHVRDLIFDPLEPDQVDDLAEVMLALLRRLDPGGVAFPANPDIR